MLLAEGDPASGEIIGGELYGHFVAGEDANEVLSHLSRNMSQHSVFVLQLHSKHGVG